MGPDTSLSAALVPGHSRAPLFATLTIAPLLPYVIQIVNMFFSMRDCQRTVPSYIIGPMAICVGEFADGVDAWHC